MRISAQQELWWRSHVAGGAWQHRCPAAAGREEMLQACVETRLGSQAHSISCQARWGQILLLSTQGCIHLPFAQC